MKTVCRVLFLGLASLLVACQPSAPVALPTVLPTSTPPALSTPTAFQPLPATPTAIVYPTFTPRIPPPTSEPSPLEKYTTTAMRSRTYGLGTLQTLEQISDEGNFIRYKFRYPSDGIVVYGFLNIPKGEGPFPVIIFLHGNYSTEGYQLMPDSTYYADRITKNGYVVFHPNFRNFGESDKGDDLYRTGLAADVLNLIPMIQLQGGQPGILSTLEPGKIGLWAHSMGGEVALRVLTITDQVDAAVLYAPVSGDLLKIANFINAGKELNTPPELISAISLNTAYGLITTPIQLYHGTGDPVVPVSWSKETCDTLTALGKNIDCTFYAGEGHNFSGNTMPRFEESFYSFFGSYLK